MRAWHIIYTRPRSEKKLAAALAKKNVEYYLPLLRMQKRWSDRTKWIEEPAFSSYVFVKIDVRNEALTVLNIPHAVNFVKTLEHPAEISEEDIELLRISIENFADSLVVRDTAELRPGQKIKIKLGPFAGKDAIIEKISGKAMILVNFPALNQSIQVEMPVEHLESPSNHVLEA